MADAATTARADQAVATVRDLYASALESQLGFGEAVSELASTLGPTSTVGDLVSQCLGNPQRLQVANGLRSLFPTMDKWATTDRDYADYIDTVEQWNKWLSAGDAIAAGISGISAEAYDSNIFAALAYTATETASDIKQAGQQAAAAVTAAAPGMFWLLVLLGFAWLASSASKLKG